MQTTNIVTGMRVYSCIAILILFLVCGCGSLVTAADSVIIQADPVTGEPPLTVTLSADVESSLGEPSSYMWNLGDGERRTEPSFSHTYQSEGIYRVNLMVEFEDGTNRYANPVQIIVGNPEATSAPTITSTQAQASVAATPTPTQPPEVTVTPTPTPAPIVTATPTPPPVVTQVIPTPIKVDGYSVTILPNKARGPVPFNVRFTSETIGGLPIAWNWNFGDGQKSTIRKPAHNYLSPGTYVVQLSVQFRGPVWVDADPITITVG